jgi:hypothetical protein
LPVEYAVKHRGCAIICGASTSLFEDLEAARKLRPEATILGVKYTASLVPEIEHIWTQHGEMTLRIRAAVNRPIIVHARPKALQTAKGTVWHIPYKREAYDSIDYIWPSLSFATGSSGVAGAMWARHGMGFDEVIMAGIGLTTADKSYTAGYPNKYSKGDSYASTDQIDNWVRILKKHQEDGKTEGIFSMSGKTRNILGEPIARYLADC